MSLLKMTGMTSQWWYNNQKRLGWLPKGILALLTHLLFPGQHQPFEEAQVRGPQEGHGTSCPEVLRRKTWVWHVAIASPAPIIMLWSFFTCITCRGSFTSYRSVQFRMVFTRSGNPSARSKHISREVPRRCFWNISNAGLTDDRPRSMDCIRQ